MKALQLFFLFVFLLLMNSCIVQFIPETGEDQDLLVVEGLITDLPGPNSIKLSKSLPLGGNNDTKPFIGCNVTISDDLGNIYSLSESVAGTYITNPDFRGIIGRWYTLHISTNFSDKGLHYESYPMELKPVPPIDSIYYEKMVIKENYVGSQPAEGCQIYLNTHDPENNCKFYRWEYTETWEFILPYSVTNNVCWVSANSDRINVKSTSAFTEDRINRYPLNFISNTTDRLKVKYSILVNQYSLNEEEYAYWEKLQNIAEQVGGLYDLTPASIPSNIWCVENPNENVLGYFSVSASSSKRIFIKDKFSGIINLYADCPADTLFGSGPLPNLNISVWILEDHSVPPPPFRIVTYDKGCIDCTVRGTNMVPDFWIEGK